MNYKTANQKIHSLLDELETTDTRFRYGLFATIKVIVLDLYRQAEYWKDESGFDYGCTKEKLEELDWHIDAMFGMRDADGHSVSDHHSWAIRAIDNATGDLCLGAIEKL